MIKDFKTGDKITGAFLIKSLDVRKTKTGRDYFNLNLSDKSGEINGKLWSVTLEQINIFSAGDIVKITGFAETFDSRPQLRVETMEQAQLTEEEMEDLIESSPINPEIMFNEIYETAEKFSNDDIKSITTALLKRHKEKLLICPAAKTFHHAIRGGLLYHTHTMLNNAKTLSKTYTFLNTDLLFAGVMLHDIAKVDEMSVNSTGAVEAYTKEGQLIGHITQCVCEIDNVSRDLNITSEVPMLLKHMILSHHFFPEFGSPKYPMIPEAEMLHHLDVMDSRMNQMETAFNSVNEGQFTPRVRALDNRNIYHYDLNEKGENNND